MSNYTDPDPPRHDPEPPATVERPCRRCRGTGQTDGADCLDCEGWGSLLIPVGKHF